MNHETAQAANYSATIFRYMLEGYQIGPLAYSNMLLSTTEPGFINDYDPLIESNFSSVAFYWPGENPYSHMGFETIEFRRDTPSSAEAAASAMRTRRAILGAHVTEVALGRVPAEAQELWRAGEESVVSPLLIAQEDCREASLPLGVCAVSRVTNRGVGKHMLHMMYPVFLRPTTVLGELQAAVQSANDEEVIT